MVDDLAPVEAALCAQEVVQQRRSQAGSPAPPMLGRCRQTRRCWEYGCVTLGADSEDENFEEGLPQDRLCIISAWFGDPDNEERRTDITSEVSSLVGSGSLARQLKVPATTERWGDPAFMCVKHLAITYEYAWLCDDERMALEGLWRRANERAQLAEDFEELVRRLGSALLPAVEEQIDTQSPRCESTGSGSYAPAAIGHTSPRWQQLGFQSCDPRTDLRTGRLAAEALIYLAEHYPFATKQMVTEARHEGVDYPFAVASINVTQLLARYLGVIEGTGSGITGCSLKSRWRPAPRPVVRRFCRLLCQGTRDTDAFGELHAGVMFRLHDLWRSLKKSNPEITVMQFSSVLEEVMVETSDFCKSADLATAAEFRMLGGKGESDFVLHKSTAELLTPGAQSHDTRERDDEGTLLESVEQTAKSVSNAAGIASTYLRGMLSA
eukprot:TRINITY_DN91313_c0_g1_i1.p1 TRINITY_DN91313_c0_g1~~TRINITY_DN91313_c0_g1_i1.p1  ORF type:complete len:438 (-),score=63.33 TRINITY_DN91313_c0_g1_i1:112-1425(-)